MSQVAELAFIFPGQGSQTVGMLADVAAELPIIQQTFAEASDAISLDLWDLAQNGPQEQQNLTENTQPLLLTASVALWRAWCEASDLRPSVMAGHSLGEFTALVCADALAFADAVQLVKKRGQFMQTAVPVGEGAMAAIIGLDDEGINAACEASCQGEVVSAVNFNSPGQVVIAGHKDAVDRAIAACKEAGAKRAMPLPVSAPFHPSLMQPAGEQLADALAAIEVSAPSCPVVQNVYAEAEQDAARIKALLIEQISSPVRWVACMQRMQAMGATHFVECGPGKVLAGLCKRIDRSLTASSLNESAHIAALKESLA
jgi:[acyl-carrier-protein] S-malonyltransferase